ncbi:hypothetical protein FJR38_00965 [Anabaena sp. UHCC 0253]|uniref:hypothetical protein n=1 Tax=Anabaena sp. UHCC 0253 TaxID=2590019 RepID=UPI001445161C|nr:hypothetical protein [Anabaena sp. UHCC 0253]MTJ51352.1 hypothetical protein [Anabaena sp. UHCC 0253]
MIAGLGEPQVGTKAWEAKFEIEKLERIIKDRIEQLAANTLNLTHRIEGLGEIEDINAQWKLDSTTDEVAMSDAFMNDFPGYEISLRFLPQKEHRNDIHLAMNAIDAIDELRTVIEPLTVDLWLFGTYYAKLAHRIVKSLPYKDCRLIHRLI